MSATSAPRTRPRGPAPTPPRPRRRTKARRRRTLWRRLALAAVLVIAGIAAYATMEPFADKAVKEIALPLRHEDIIRQQAAEKGVDASLIAGVIYVESRFRDQTSHAGAKGLMQILPSTAHYIAQKSGGTQFEQGDLATPQINIAYGSWYLRYLLDRYEGNQLLALAAYNAGEGEVDGWLHGAAAEGEDFEVATHIPFPETREYVTRVLSVRDRYRREYARELGLR